MNKTKIDWCDMTFNPVTGCLHGCEYCYARGISKRFASKSFKEWEHIYSENCTHDLHDSHLTNGKIEPYPYGFQPTFHRYRLDEPSKKTKGQKIFVCSMADLFGDWVPDEWIEEVFKACEAAPQHTYLFLTKNPSKIPKTTYIFSGVFKSHTNNYWFGTSIATQKDLSDRIIDLLSVNGNRFLSIEPIHEKIKLTKIDLIGAYVDAVNGKEYHMFGGGNFRKVHWVIVGAESGNRKGMVIPKREWIEGLVEQCKAAGVPVFMKESLRELMGQDFIQEWPEKLRSNKR